jgi:hypothetical protein
MVIINEKKRHVNVHTAFALIFYNTLLVYNLS